MRPQDVPAGPLLLDTDVVSYLHTKSGPYADFSALVAGHLLTISFVTYAEVLALGHTARWGPRRMAGLTAMLARYVVLPYTAAVAERWAQIHPRVKGHLHDGGTNDVWTAAVALGSTPQLPVVTNNLTDFSAIGQHAPDLRLVHPDL